MDWPAKEKVRDAAVSVVVVSAFVGAFLALADVVISWGMKFLIPHH